MSDGNQGENNLEFFQCMLDNLEQADLTQLANLESLDGFSNLFGIDQNGSEFPSQTLEQIGSLAAIISVPQPEKPGNLHVPSSLPAMEDWPGDLSFNVSFRNNPGRTKKTTAWTFSEMKNKLYVRRDAPCSIGFSTNRDINNAVIRAVAYFSYSSDALKVVKRCINHSIEEIKQNIFEAEHLIRCSSSNAVYEINQVNDRHSVIVPFENPSAGQEYSTYIYKFLCYGSCAGGPNRRPMLLVFTLEYENRVIGQRKFHLKICSSPGRDIEIEENQLQNGYSKSTTGTDTLSGMCNKRKHMETTLPPTNKEVSSPKKKGLSIMVKDVDCYQFLKQMKYLYEVGRAAKSFSGFTKLCVYSSHSEEEVSS